MGDSGKMGGLIEEMWPRVSSGSRNLQENVFM